MDLAILPLMFGVLYFVMIRPQQKRQRELAAMLGALKTGDDVITVGGMYGTIVDLDDESVDLLVSEPDTVLRFRREAIVRIVAEDDEPSDDELLEGEAVDDVTVDELSDDMNASDASANGNLSS